MGKKKKQILTPLDEIKDGQQFQRIVAELFRCLKTEIHNYSIVDVSVMDSGVGPDGGCDILVEFYFEDMIAKHSYKWVVECKCYSRCVGFKDLNPNLKMILDSKKANGYLLVCKTDASSSLKRLFEEYNNNSEKKYYVWNGDRLWYLCSLFNSIIKAFFPKYYKKYVAKDEKEFSALVNNFKNEGGLKK